MDVGVVDGDYGGGCGERCDDGQTNGVIENYAVEHVRKMVTVIGDDVHSNDMYTMMASCLVRTRLKGP